MNKPRRKELEKAMDLLRQAFEIIETVRDEEQEAFDNLPEGLQESERGEMMEESIYDMESAMDEIDSQIDTLDEVISR